MKRLIFLVSFLEGASVMAIELLSAKVLAPYFGISLVVWASVFITTLGGLALGYYYGSKLANSPGSKKKLLIIFSFTTLFTALIPLIGNLIFDSLIGLSLFPGSLIACSVVNLPLLFCFGTVSPVLIRFLGKFNSNEGLNSSQIYSISTLGGVLMTFFTGLYFMPNVGIRESYYLTAGILLIATLLLVVYNYSDERSN